MKVIELLRRLNELPNSMLSSEVAMGYEYDGIDMIHEKVTQVLETEEIGSARTLILGSKDYKRD